MTFQNQSFRATVTGGLFAAVLLGFSSPVGTAAEITREATTISGATILVGAYNGPRDATHGIGHSNGGWTTRERLTNSGAFYRIIPP